MRNGQSGRAQPSCRLPCPRVVSPNLNFQCPKKSQRAKKSLNPLFSKNSELCLAPTRVGAPRLHSRVHPQNSAAQMLMSPPQLCPEGGKPPPPSVAMPLTQIPVICLKGKFIFLRKGTPMYFLKVVLKNKKLATLSPIKLLIFFWLHNWHFFSNLKFLLFCLRPNLLKISVFAHN